MYQCFRTRTPIHVDGKLDEAAWRKAPKSPRFIDVIGGTPGLYDTRSAVLWDDENLYIGFWCEEPFPAAQIAQRDGLLGLKMPWKCWPRWRRYLLRVRNQRPHYVYEVSISGRTPSDRRAYAMCPSLDALPKTR